MRKCYFFKMLAIFSVLFFSAQYAIAQYTVSGTVTDAATGETLVGVTIFDSETNSGTSTDINGEYTLELPAGETELRFSSVGYITRNVEVSGSNGQTVTLDVEMQSDVANLEELVVTGLASSVKRENLANSVSSVSAEDLTGTTSPPTIDNGLSGKFPGVNIRSNSGAPGGGFNVQLRGISTLGAGSSQPLYIIDGVYLNNSTVSNGRSITTGATGASEDNGANRLADLNPEDIENIEILKGPSAAAIYGQRANAGVIIITTKGGQAGETEVSVQQSTGFSKALNLLGVASWNEDKINTLFGSAAEVQKYNDAENSGNIHNYEEEVYGETGLMSETNISVSGGTSKTRFFVSGGYHYEEGIIKNTNFNRGNIRANIDHNLTDNIRISSNSSYTKTDNQRGFTGNQNGSGASMGYALAYVPTYAQLFPDEEGNYPNNSYFDDNPLAVRDLAENNEDINRFIQSVSVDADLLATDVSRLSLSVNGGFDFLNFSSLIYLPEILQSQQARANPGDVVRTSDDNLNTNLQATLLYNNQLNSEIGLFDLTTQIGFTRFAQNQRREQLRGQGLATGQKTIGQSAIQSVLTQQTIEIVELGWFAQQEINFDDKLIGTVGARIDRSSLNLDQDQYYFFPKASLAANISNFDFWTVDEISQLKLRVAYGQTGGVPNYGNTFSVLNPVSMDGDLGSVVSTREFDPELEPETAEEFEFGADISAFEDRISLSATYYQKNVNDLILDLSTATSTGITAIATNAADLTNKGIELGLNARPVSNPNFAWTTDILYWHNDSEITRLDIPEAVQGGFGVSLGNYLLQEGYSPTTVVGIPADPSGSGSPLYTIYGDAQPDFQMSFGNQFTFLQNFNFNFLFHYSEGNYNVNLFQFLTDGGGTSNDWNEDSGDGTPKGLERVGMLPPEAYVQEASYVKLREIGLSYTVPTETLQQIFGNSVSGIRLGVSANNVWMWTKYDGYDPEVSTFGTQSINQSVDVAPYPSARKVLFNVKFDF
ncbi:MAG: SusC/RagA family TonB-linked outer membrane protein [Gracilimonas sp.]